MKPPRAALFAIGFFLLAHLPIDAHAQGTPGNAPGSQTGDTGGAFTGLASAPEANLFTGIAQTSIPIDAPPGRLGLAPILALSYSSNAGPGPYGFGWSLPLPRVHRSTRHGVPRYEDSDDFVLEMPGAMMELERIAGSPSGYRAKYESSFLRIGFDRDANSWTVIDKLGVTFVFGSRAATRTGRGAERGRTFAWLLERVEDPAGNRIDFAWRGGGPENTSRGLPDVIRYGANSRTGLPHFAEVLFEWVPVTHPGLVSWRDGYPDPLDVRLAAVSTRTHELAARRYDFSYEEDSVTADLRLAGVTLTAFAEAASDDVQLPSTVFVYAPSLHDGWPALGTPSPGEDPYEIEGAGHLRLGRNSITADNLDLNGDAIIDRVDTSPHPPNVWLGTGRRFEAAGSWNWPTATAAPRVLRDGDSDGDLRSNVFDLDDDSFADLVDSDAASCAATAGFWCVWRGSATGFASTPTTWRSPSPQLRTTASGGSKVVTDLVDVDADGRLDLVDASSHSTTAPNWKVYRNTGSGFATTATNFAAPVPWISRTSSGRVTHGLFDINADSLPDLVVADSFGYDDARWGRFPFWHVYFHDGSGLAAQPVEWAIDGGVGEGTGLPNFLSLRATDGSMIADLFDITGDGRPDLVRRTRGLEPQFSGVPGLCHQQNGCRSPDIEDSAVSSGYCCFNLLVFANTGSSFAQPVAWSSPAHGLRADFETCPTSEAQCAGALIYDFDFFDIDGDGLVEFVERHTSGLKPYSWMVHPHPASAGGGGARPNVLVAMRNGVGGETMLRYRAAAGTPETRIPHPHWVVSERELRDSIFDQAPLRTSFAYRGGTYDTAEREMRGFSLVQEVDPSGNLRVREYHQDRRRAGRLRRMTNLAAPPCDASDPEDSGDPCSPWNFKLGTTEYEWPASGPVLLARESDVPFHEGASVENLRRTTTYSYDAYGNVARRKVESPLAATSITTTEYEHHVADRPGGIPRTYHVSKPSHALTKEEGKASPLVERSFEYEWNQPAPASLAVASTCMTWAGAECSHWSRRTFEYEPNGNVLVAHAPDGAISRTKYDESFHFAVQSVNAVGLATASVTDPRTGLVTETVAPNGNRLRARFDGLGRLLRSWGPGTSKVAPLKRLEYAPGSLGDSPPRVVIHQEGAGTQATFFDGLGRTVATKAESLDGDTPVAVVSGLKRYDDRVLVAAEALPFESTDPDVETLSERFEDAPAWIEFEYDAAARLSRTRSPDGATSVVDRSAPGILRTDDANMTGGKFPGAVSLEVFDGLGRRLLRETCSRPPAESQPYECRAGSLVRRESWTHDGLGRVVETRTEGLGIAAGDSVTRVERDGLGGRTSVFHSNAGTWRFASDDNGRLVEVLKPDGTRLTTSYDEAGRIRRRRGPTSRASYSYHAAGGGIGKLRKMSTRTRAVRVSEVSNYDDRGRIESRERRVGARHASPGHLHVTYRYDDLDRRIATAFEDWTAGGSEVVTTFDAIGRERSVSTGERTYVADSLRDSEGRLRRVDYGNGVSDLIGYESRSNSLRTTGRLRCMRSTWTAAAEPGPCETEAGDLDAAVFAAYDDNGHLLGVDDALRAVGDPLQSSRRYSYDAAGRLVGAEYGDTGLETYAFDPLGNLRRKGPVRIEYEDPEHPSRISFTRFTGGDPYRFEYDANGRRTSDGERTFVYDDWDRLSQVWIGDEIVAEYGYTDTGERVFTRDAERTEFELGDGVRVASDRIERTIAFAGRPAAVERYTPERPGESRPREVFPTDVTFLHLDHQQSVRMTTDADGRVLEHLRYAPFGERTGLFDANGNWSDPPATRYSFTGHAEDRSAGLLFMGARHYDPGTASFLTLDPAMQFASPYAYAGGNPVLGRDPDGKLFQLTALEILAIAAGTATFVDSIVRTGDLGHSLTAGVFAGFSVYFSNQLSTAIARPLARTGYTWLQTTVSVASSGFQALEAVEAIEDGRYAGGIVAAGMLASSLIGIESVQDPGAGTTPGETQERHGIKDRGVIDGRVVIDVNGICATRPGCVTNTLIAAQENLRVLFTGQAACVGGCQHVADLTQGHLDDNKNVLLRCNSFGAIKCLGAIQKGGLASALQQRTPEGLPRLAVEMSGAPLLRPPTLKNVTYQVNLFDPVVWVGTGYSTPLNSDVVLGRNWWVPAPVIVHHSQMYEKPFREALGDILP